MARRIPNCLPVETGLRAILVALLVPTALAASLIASRSASAEWLNVGQTARQLLTRAPAHPPEVVGEGVPIYPQSRAGLPYVDPLAQPEFIGVPIPCPPGCVDAWYVNAEALYFRLEYDDDFTLSRNQRLESHDFEWRGRLIIGRQLDCLDGFEVGYVGPFYWDTQVTTVDAGGNLQSRFAPVAPLTDADVSAFNDAVEHRQTYQTRLHSFEANRRWWGWDVMSLLVGGRYIHLTDDYRFESLDAGGDRGDFRWRGRNSLVGPQVGGELAWAFSPRLRGSVRGKASAMANIYRTNAYLINANTLVLDNSHDSIAFAAMGEIGIHGAYAVTPRLTVRGGYEAWYLYGLLIASEQPNMVDISERTGRSRDRTGDYWLHGFSAGAELFW